MHVHERVLFSGGPRVGVVGDATLPHFVSLGAKAQGLEAALCSFSVFKNNYADS